MSLINQVLNDLEKRGASTDIGDATLCVVAIRQQHGKFWLLVATATVLVVAAIAWLKWGTDDPLKAPSVALATAPASMEVQPASQPADTATAEVPPELAAPALRLSFDLDSASNAAPAQEKPLLLLTPFISAVSPNPAISLGMPQTVTISGINYASDATITLRTPGGKAYAKRQIVTQNSEKIVISTNFADIAGPWSVEVVNAGDHSSGQLSSGQFTFTVQADAEVASVQTQNKAALTAAKGARSSAKPAAVEMQSAVISAGGVSKQPTQMTTQQQAENKFRNAYVLMQQGQASAAIRGFKAALQLDAGHLVARQTLVRLLLDDKRNAEAERVLQEGLKHDPKQSSLAMLLARMQVARDELPKALDTLQKTLPYAQQQADYQAFVAALMQRLNRHKEAIVYYQNALQLNPQSGVWLMGLGISLRAEQRNADARDAFNRAMASHNLSAELQAFVTQQLKEL